MGIGIANHHVEGELRKPVISKRTRWVYVLQHRNNRFSFHVIFHIARHTETLREVFDTQTLSKSIRGESPIETRRDKRATVANVYNRKRFSDTILPSRAIPRSPR